MRQAVAHFSSRHSEELIEYAPQSFLVINPEYENRRADFMRALLKKHGRRFPWLPCPSHIPAGEPGRCYESAFRVAVDHGMAYCEGLLVTPQLVVMAHAWNCTPDGYAIDSLINPGREPYLFYLGVPFQTEYIVQHEKKVGYYGLLDGHPTLGDTIGPYADPPEAWLHSVKNI